MQILTQNLAQVAAEYGFLRVRRGTVTLGPKFTELKEICAYCVIHIPKQLHTI